jgi:predicted metalloprotease
MRVVARWAIAVLAAVSLTACAQGVGGTAAVGGIAPATTATTATTDRPSPTSSPSAPRPTTAGGTDDSSVPGSSDPDSSAVPTLASGVTIDELAEDISAAELIVDGYWTTHWPDFFTGTYVSPEVVGLYDGTDPADTPTCGGEPLDSFNAYYCIPEQYVAWDVGLLLTGADEIGDSWVYLVIAHEYGHAVQAQLEPSLVAAQDELQADCLGAAALYGAAADGKLSFDAGDEAELIGSLTALADQMPWTMASDHGDAFQRVDWFTLGRDGGVDACLDAAASGAPTTG